jgi:hypothetical protein
MAGNFFGQPQQGAAVVDGGFAVNVSSHWRQLYSNSDFEGANVSHAQPSRAAGAGGGGGQGIGPFTSSAGADALSFMGGLTGSSSRR